MPYIKEQDAFEIQKQGNFIQAQLAQEGNFVSTQDAFIEEDYKPSLKEYGKAAVETVSEFIGIPKIIKAVKAATGKDKEEYRKLVSDPTTIPDPFGTRELSAQLLTGGTGIKKFEEWAKEAGLSGKVQPELAKLSGRLLSIAGGLKAGQWASREVAKGLVGLAKASTQGNFLANWITAGTEYAVAFAGDETIQEAASYFNKEKELTLTNLVKSGKNITEEAAFSMFKGGLNNVVKFSVKGIDAAVPLSMITRGAWDSFRALRNDGTINQEEMNKIILYMGIDGAFKYFGGKKLKTIAKQLGHTESVLWQDLFRNMSVEDIDSVRKAGTLLLSQQLPQDFYAIDKANQMEVLKDINYQLASKKLISDIIPSLDFSKFAKSEKNITQSINSLGEGFQQTSKTELTKTDLTKVAHSLDTAEQAELPKPTKEHPAEFKLYEETGALIHKYAERFGEKVVPKKALGVFYPKTNNIFIDSANNLSTAVHEVTHFIDKKQNISNKITDKKTKGQLTDVYVNYYGGGKKNHPLKKRMTEGYAAFIQNYTMFPNKMTKEYPDLVNRFISKGDKNIKEFVKDARGIVNKYQQLDPLQKVGAKILSDKRKSVEKSFLTWKDKATTEVFDNVWPIEKIGRIAGVTETKADPSLWIRMYNNINSVIINNFNGDKGYWTLDENLDFTKAFDYNWKSLSNKLSDDNFAKWLVARREKFAYDKLDTYDKLINDADIAILDVKDKIDAGEIENVKKATSALRNAEKVKAELKIEKEHLFKILENDNFDRSVVTQAYTDHKDRFPEETKMFDDLVKADLDLLLKTQLINPEQYKELVQNEGYATFKRDTYNDIIGEPTDAIPISIKGVGKTKVSSLYGRKGSELTIINPVYSSIINHNEIMKKAMRQVVYNKLADISDKLPGLFQKVELKPAVDKASGKILFPQEKDPNIIMARQNYKRIPLMVNKEIKQVVDECLNTQNIHLLEGLLIDASRMFVKGTTGAYPAFAFTNFFVDQISAAAQTSHKVKPVLGPINNIIKVLKNSQGEEAKYLEEYLMLGGERQTFVGWQNLSPSDLFSAINKEKTGLQKIKDYVDKGLDILSMPSQYSEIMTRASEYTKARKAGKDQIAALEDAGAVTATFHHKGRLGGGTVGRTYIGSMPFFNASLQVLNTYYRKLDDPKTRPRAAFVTAALTAASVGSMAYLAKNATEEQKQAYIGLRAEEFSKYIYLPHWDGKRLLRFKVPEQMNAFATMTNMVIADKTLNAKYKTSEYVDGLTAWIPEQLNISDPYRQFYTLTPHLFQPVMGITTGKRMWPKVKDLESISMKLLPPEERFYPSTSAFAKALGKGLNLSPIKIDYLIEGYLGRATRPFVGKKMFNPFVREMYFTASRNIQNFYDFKEQNAIDYKSYRENRGSFSDEEKRKIVENYSAIKRTDILLDSYRKVSKVNETDPVLRDLRTQILDEIDTLY